MDVLGKWIVFIGCFVSRVFTMGVDNDSAIQDYGRLRNDLLTRPVIVHKIPAEVTFTTSDPWVLNLKMYLMQVVQVDQIEQLMTVAGQFSVWWTHTGLTWDPSSYGSLETVVMATDEMWVPQLAVWIGDRDSTTLSYPETLTLNASGLVSCESLSHVTFRCPIDVRKFPFDTQTCGFAPYVINQRLSTVPVVLYLEGESIFTSGLGNDDPYNIKGEWVLLNFSVGTFNNSIDNVYPNYILTVRRQRLYYVIVVIFPMVVTSVMIPLVFLIPENSGEKISYLVTIFTSSAIFLSYISQVMPKNLSTATPYLAILLTEVISLGLFATLATLWLIIKYNSEEKQKLIKQKIFKNNKPTSNEKEKKARVVEIATEEKIQRQDTREQEVQIEFDDTRNGDKVAISETRITGCQLDLYFFCLFFTGQTVFLIFLFFGTDWLD
ncbi:hypothetical protein Btru_038667 [Bulinus truncatus]|nr:hypothetical protein Btru_038667 [Bulinus truncatus]